MSKTSSEKAKRTTSFRFKLNDSSDLSSDNNLNKTIKASTSDINALSTSHNKQNIKLRDDKLWTPLMLHKSPATSIKAEAQVHNDSFSRASTISNEKQLIESKMIALSADNIKKMCSSTLLYDINKETSITNEFMCDIDTIVPALKETTV